MLDFHFEELQMKVKMVFFAGGIYILETIKSILEVVS